MKEIISQTGDAQGWQLCLSELDFIVLFLSVFSLVWCSRIAFSLLMARLHAVKWSSIRIYNHFTRQISQSLADLLLLKAAECKIKSIVSGLTHTPFLLP